MKTITSVEAPVTISAAPAPGNMPPKTTFSAFLKDGREIVLREMTGKDLMYVEEELDEYKDNRKTFHLMERLNVGEHKLTFEEISDLSVKDIKVISDLIYQANGEAEDSDKGKDPK